MTFHALSTPLLDNVFTINLPAAGQKVWVHILSCKLAYDLQPIVKNKPRRAIVKGDHCKQFRSVVADQLATNRMINESYDPVWLGLEEHARWVSKICMCAFQHVNGLCLFYTAHILNVSCGTILRGDFKLNLFTCFMYVCQKLCW